MNYPNDIEEKLGFDEIRDLVVKACRSRAGKELAQKLSFSSNYKIVTIWLNQAVQYKQLIESGNQPVITQIDVRPFLEKLAEKHSVLNVEELVDIRSLCTDVEELLTFFEGDKASLTFLTDLIKDFEKPTDIIRSISSAFDEFGNWKKNASRKLAALLEEIESNKREAYSIIQRIYNNASGKKWTAETEITVKEGRLVIPIFAEHKRKVKGIMHDESGGGNILYIEPIEVLEASNRQKELELDRDREMQRILKSITEDIRVYLTDLKGFSQRMAVFDLIRAKAELAVQIQADLPIVIQSSDCTVKNMYHPLLLLANKDKKKETVPMNLALNEEQRFIIISGPNAGGKSVTIKSLALNQYMVQSGLLPCCDPESELGFYKQMFVDIGDNQSIDNDLSSYSSHLTAMKHFLAKSNPSTLLIIDEIGTGTDPNFGGAMAEAVLIELNKKKPRGAITTHFGNVKSLAKKQEGMINASMLYDAKKLQPLYQLAVGKPGSSFALEVAQNIGLPKRIISTARQRSNIKQQKTDELLATLEVERKELDQRDLELKEQEAYISTLKSEYQALKKSIEKNRKEIIESAEHKAVALIEGANAEIEKTIKTIREAKADKTKTKSARTKLEKSKERIIGKTDEQPETSPEKVKLTVGMEVKIPNSSSRGEIVEIRKDKAVVVAGIMKSTYSLRDLKPVQSKKKAAKQKVSVGFVSRQQHFAIEMDVRGMRANEAIKEIDRWIDDAVVIGANNLRLIHGKGDGILKKVIRDYYHNSGIVKRIRYEDVRLGGEGVSIIELA